MVVISDSVEVDPRRIGRVSVFNWRAHQCVSLRWPSCHRRTAFWRGRLACLRDSYVRVRVVTFELLRHLFGHHSKRSVHNQVEGGYSEAILVLEQSFNSGSNCWSQRENSSQQADSYQLQRAWAQFMVLEFAKLFEEKFRRRTAVFRIQRERCVCVRTL